MQTHVKITSADRPHLVLLSSVAGVGCKSIEKILKYRVRQRMTWQEFWRRRVGVFEELRLSQKAVGRVEDLDWEEELATQDEQLLEMGIQVVSVADQEYPQYLRQIPDPPWILFVRGPVQHLSQMHVPLAFVGSRENTVYGKQAVHKLIGELSQSCQPTIVSGGMYGIDMLSHLAAVQYGLPTVVVLGYGLQNVWPAFLQEDFQQLLDSGAVFVSEVAPYMSGSKSNFLRRNRIVAGMSVMTVVVEAAAQSGSLTTAKLALEYNRCVGAVPGPITSDFSEGTKALLNQGAVCVSSSTDILEEVKHQVQINTHLAQPALLAQLQPEVADLSTTQKQLYDYLQQQPASMVELLQTFPDTEGEIVEELLELELRQLITQQLGVYSCVTG